MAVAVAFATTLVAAGPAAAAGDGLLLSSDGVTFATSYQGELFHAVGAMVPGDTQSGSFWVKNATTDIAYLRVGVGSVSPTTSDAFLESLTLRAGAGDAASDDVPLTRGLVCTSLLQPLLLAAGATVQVNLVLHLDPDAPSETQNASTKVSMVASLSNAAPRDYGANICRGDFAPLPTPDTGTAPTVAPTASPSSVPGTVPSITPTPGPSSPGTPSSLPVAGGAIGTIASNTARLFQEYDIIVLVLAFTIGAIASYFVERARSRRARPSRGTDNT